MFLKMLVPVLSSLSGFAIWGLDYVWPNRTTRNFKRLRIAAFVFLFVSLVVTGVLLVVDERNHQSEKMALITRIDGLREELQPVIAIAGERHPGIDESTALALLRQDVEDLGRLTRHMNSRELSAGEYSALVASMKPFKGQTFWIITQTNDYDPTSEQIRFAEQLESALKSAGWRKHDVLGGRAYRRVSQSGIEIASGSAMSARHAASALLSTLAQELSIAAKPGVIYEDIDPKVVLIDVGLK